MSAATASSTETTIFVRLLEEAVDVWRPVSARRITPATYRIADDPAPADERWSFGPGETVVAEEHDHGSSPVLVAVARASAFDGRSLASLAVAS